MCIKVQLQPYHAAEFKIEPVDPTDFLGFSFIHDQATILKVIPQWDAATHPHALSFRSSNLVADALASHLSLELRKGEQDIQGQPAHRRRGVELLGDRDEAHAASIEGFYHLGEVGQTARQ